MIRIALFSALTAVGAYIALPLPFTPVPFTLQVFFCILSSLALGAWDGAMSQLLYLALGGLGIPVFAGGNAGLGVLMGPTGGFLLGFVPAAYIVGVLDGMLDRGRGPRGCRVIVGLSGLMVIHGLGALWLATAMNIALPKAVVIGSLPYIGPDLVKAAAAVSIADAIKQRVPRISHLPLG